MEVINLNKDYVQYSKRVTKWAMILITFVMIACLIIVAFCDVPERNVAAVVQLFTSFCAVFGVTVGAYQGNSVLEKYSKAKYQYENLTQHVEEDDESDDGCGNG